MGDEVVRLKEVPVPRFAIGQKVWVTNIKNGKESFPCPDCLGTRTWNVSNAAGFSGVVNCPRCDGKGELAQQSWTADVRQLTVGTVKIDTARDWDGEYIRYMCEETGVGSGSCWGEGSLFETELAARTLAEVKAAAAVKGLDEGPQKRARNEFRHLSAYQLRDATTKAAEDRAWHAEYDLNRLRERLFELLEPDRYMMSHGFEEDEHRVEGAPMSGSLTLDDKQRTLLVESLMSWDSDSTKWLINRRAEKAKECKCD